MSWLHGIDRQPGILILCHIETEKGGGFAWLSC